MPSEKYARAPEILEHSRAIGRHYDLYRGALLPDRSRPRCAGTKRRARWIVATNRGDRIKARFVAMSNGPLNRPKLPGIPGIESFAGPLVPHQPLGLRVHRRRLQREPHGPARQARRHHRHRRDRGAVRAAPRRSGRAPLRVPAHAVVDRRARQPPDRSGVGEEPRSRAGTSTAWTTSTSLVSGGFQAEDLVSDGWTDIIRKLLVMVQAAPAATLAGLDIMKTMELADFQKMEQIRARVDQIVEDARDRRGAEAVLPPVLQASVLPRRVPRHLQPAERDARRHAGQGRRAHHREGRRRERRRVRARLPDLRDRLRGRHRLHAARRLRDPRARRRHADREVGRRRPHAPRHAQPRLPELLHHGQPAERLHGELSAQR